MVQPQIETLSEHAKDVLATQPRTRILLSTKDLADADRRAKDEQTNAGNRAIARQANVSEMDNVPPLSEFLPRLSDYQVRDFLPSITDIHGLRNNPDLAYADKTTGERADDLRLRMHRGQLAGDHDETVRSFINSFWHIIAALHQPSASNPPSSVGGAIAQVASAPQRIIGIHPLQAVNQLSDTYETFVHAPIMTTILGESDAALHGVIDTLDKLAGGHGLANGDFQNRIEANIKAGMDVVPARILAFQETTQWPAWVKTFLNVAVDPANAAFGAGAAADVVRGIPRLLRGTEPFTILGKGTIDILAKALVRLPNETIQQFGLRVAGLGQGIAGGAEGELSETLALGVGKSVQIGERGWSIERMSDAGSSKDIVHMFSAESLYKENHISIMLSKTRLEGQWEISVLPFRVKGGPPNPIIPPREIPLNQSELRDALRVIAATFPDVRSVVGDRVTLGHPPGVQMVYLDRFRKPLEKPTVAQLLKEGGYDAGAFVGKSSAENDLAQENAIKRAMAIRAGKLEISGGAGEYVYKSPTMEHVAKQASPLFDPTKVKSGLAKDILSQFDGAMKYEPGTFDFLIHNQLGALAVINDQLYNATMSHLASIAPSLGRLFKTEATTDRVPWVDGKPFLGDFVARATQPKNWKLLNELQQTSVLRLYKMLDDAALVEVQNGTLKQEIVDAAIKQFKETGVHYMPQTVIGLHDKPFLPKIGIAGQEVIQRSSAIEPRYYESVEVGTRAGKLYDTLDNAVQDYFKARQRGQVNYELEKALEKFGLRPGEPVTYEGGLQNIPQFFRGFHFEGERGEEYARRLDEVLNPRSKVGVISTFFNAMRSSQTLGHSVAPLYQNFPLLAGGPQGWEAWARAWMGHWQSLLDPNNRARFIHENHQEWVESIMEGVLFGSGELMSQFDKLGTITALSQYAARHPDSTVARAGVDALQAAIRLGAGVYNRAQSSYQTELDFAKFFYHRALRPMALRVLEKNPKALEDLSSHVNKMSGSISTEAMGIGPTQRQLVEPFLSYSPRFLRASAGLTLDMFRGGLRGDEARRAMLYMMFADMAFNKVYTQLFDRFNQVDWNPLHGNFYHQIVPWDKDFWRVSMDTPDGPLNIPHGGKIRTVYKMFGDIMRAMHDNPEGFLQWGLMNPGAFRDNPLLRWVRYEASPALENGFELLNRTDSLGRSIPLNNPIDWAKLIGTDFLPIAIKSMYDGGALNKYAGAIVAGGSRAEPMLAGQQFTRLANKYAKDSGTTKQTWEELNTIERDNLLREHEDLRLAQDKSNVEKAKLLSNEQESKVFDRFDKIAKDQLAQHNAAADQFLRTGDGKAFRDSVTNANKAASGQRQGLEKDFPDVFADLDKLYKKRLEAGHADMVDQALHEYTNRIFGSETQTSAGDFDFKAADRITVELARKYGARTIQLVKDFIEQQKENPKVGPLNPVVAEYYADVLKLRPYWEIAQDILGQDEADDLEAFRRLPADEQRIDPQRARFKAEEKRVAIAKLQFRHENPDLDEALKKFYR